MLGHARRTLVAIIWTVALVTLLAACAPSAAPPPAPTSAPAAPPAAKPAAAPTTAPAAKPAAAPTTAPAAKPPAAPAAAPTAAAQPKPTGPAEWVVAITEEAATFDPARRTTSGSRMVWLHMFDSLVGIEGANFRVTPYLAESWNRVDERTWEFKLRRGVKFHNGDDFTAADVKYSLDLFKSDQSESKVYMGEVTDVDVVDPYTVRIRSSSANPALFGNLSSLPIMPKAAREKAGDEGFARQSVGTGPYKFVQFNRGQHLILEANPNYWRGPVFPRKLTLRPILDASTRVAELQTGGAHIILSPPVGRLAEIDRGDTQIMPLKAGRMIPFPFNTKDKPFDDVRVRQAANYAVDREAIIKNVLEGRGQPLHGPFAPGWLGYDPDIKPYPYDPAKAKQLLAEAGYPNGFETVWTTTSGVFLKDSEIVQAAASQLAQVGIKVQIIPAERAKLIADWTGGLFKGITSVQWGTAYEPDAMITWTLHERKGHKPDPQLNSLIEQSRKIPDPQQRIKSYQQLSRYVHDQAYWLFIHAQDEFYGKRREIPWLPHPIGGGYTYTAYYVVPGGSY